MGEILLNIQDQTTYTLALTGTPWRSDQAPIVLARYADPDNRIQWKLPVWSGGNRG